MIALKLKTVLANYLIVFLVSNSAISFVAVTISLRVGKALRHTDIPLYVHTFVSRIRMHQESSTGLPFRE
jgi:hypothetical protein